MSWYLPLTEYSTITAWMSRDGLFATGHFTPDQLSVLQAFLLSHMGQWSAFHDDLYCMSNARWKLPIARSYDAAIENINSATPQDISQILINTAGALYVHALRHLPLSQNQISTALRLALAADSNTGYVHATSRASYALRANPTLTPSYLQGATAELLPLGPDAFTAHRPPALTHLASIASLSSRQALLDQIILCPPSYSPHISSLILTLLPGTTLTPEHLKFLATSYLFKGRVYTNAASFWLHSAMDPSTAISLLKSTSTLNPPIAKGQLSAWYEVILMSPPLLADRDIQRYLAPRLRRQGLRVLLPHLPSTERLGVLSGYLGKAPAFVRDMLKAYPIDPATPKADWLPFLKSTTPDVIRHLAFCALGNQSVRKP